MTRTLGLPLLGEALHAELGAAISIELDGKIFIPLHDLQSNLAALVSLDGSNLTRYDYSAFGEEIQDGPTLSPWSFSSKRRDKESGLVHYGRRFYIPTLGHWLTPDPSGFTDGMNLYAYVKNEPLMHFDEYGLWGEYGPMGALYSQEIRQNWMAVYNSPRFQGAMQMMGGASLMAKGLPLLSTPLFLAGAASIAYGADVFATGLHSFVNGTPRPTTTRTLLEQTGMSPTMAAVTEFAISPRGGPKSAGQISKLTSKDLGFFGKIQNGQKFRSFTKNYYRDNLKILTGKNPPSNIEAHHVFPQVLRERFLKNGINIDDPKYLVWWERDAHRRVAREYNDLWTVFVRKNPNATSTQVLDEGRRLMNKYGIEVNY